MTILEWKGDPDNLLLQDSVSGQILYSLKSFGQFHWIGCTLLNKTLYYQGRVDEPIASIKDDSKVVLRGEELIMPLYSSNWYSS